MNLGLQFFSTASEEFTAAGFFQLSFTALTLRARAEINSHFGASAGRADARLRDEGDVGHRRGAATTPIRALAAAPLRAAARRLAGFVARSSHTAPGIARRSRLASGPGGLQQNVNLFLREPLAGGEPKRTPGILQLTNVPRQGRRELLQPLPGCI